MHCNAVGKTYLATINTEWSMIDPIQIFLLSEMNYSSEETLRIELSEHISDRTGQFSVIETCDASHIKSLIIQQEDYDRYEHRKVDERLVIIPESISRLIAVETIKINACITELPVALSKLNNLKLLDLTGCYNLSSIHDKIAEMKYLKIKSGDIISRASAVVFIKVPETGITPEVFSTIRSASQKKIEQLLIRQKPYPRREAFALPDEIIDFTELKMLCITGNLSSLPMWIANMRTLRSMTLNCSDLKALPSSIGNLSNLTSLDLSVCDNLKSFPSSMQNLPHLTTVKLSWCSFESIPSGIEYLREVTF